MSIWSRSSWCELSSGCGVEGGITDKQKEDWEKVDDFLWSDPSTVANNVAGCLCNLVVRLKCNVLKIWF